MWQRSDHVEERSRQSFHQAVAWSVLFVSTQLELPIVGLSLHPMECNRSSQRPLSYHCSSRSRLRPRGSARIPIRSSPIIIESTMRLDSFALSHVTTLRSAAFFVGSLSHMKPNPAMIRWETEERNFAMNRSPEVVRLASDCRTRIAKRSTGCHRSQSDLRAKQC